MPEPLTVNLSRPIRTVRLVHAAEVLPTYPRAPGESPVGQIEAAVRAERARIEGELAQERAGLAQLCRTVGKMVEGLERVHQDTIAAHRTEIAKLAVEIARKILMHKVSRNEHDIQAIVVEALKRAPASQGIMIRLHPEDLARCQQLQQENREGPFADVEFTADWSIGRGECLVETPKGVVRSFIEEHLERIAEALSEVE